MLDPSHSAVVFRSPVSDVSTSFLLLDSASRCQRLHGLQCHRSLTLVGRLGVAACRLVTLLAFAGLMVPALSGMGFATRFARGLVGLVALAFAFGALYLVDLHGHDSVIIYTASGFRGSYLRSATSYSVTACLMALQSESLRLLTPKHGFTPDPPMFTPQFQAPKQMAVCTPRLIFLGFLGISSHLLLYLISSSQKMSQPRLEPKNHSVGCHTSQK